MRWFLATVLLPACLLSGGRCTAQDEVGWGGMSMAAYPGYSFYALPVANAGLGRDWVTSSTLQWQMGYNYSVVPVRIEFEHRMPSAFKGRIEIESPSGFYSEEAAGSYPAVYSQEILVPPSVPHTYMFAPRICPQSQIMGPVEFTVRLFKSGMEKPYATQTVSAIQLEPGYLHSLWLDGLTDAEGNPAVLTDGINPGNQLELQLPREFSEMDDILSSLHFIISVDHRQVTGLPLAARDFAFVVADLSQVRLWPQEEQSALVSFMVGGGHLCLYNAGIEPWEGLAIDQPTAVGRGYLLPVAGKMIEARKAMLTWLEGELEEFVLWSGGTSSGWKIDEKIDMGKFGGAFFFLEDVASAKSDQKVVSHRQGYLNPIWIYREACRSGASEPWESALTLNVGKTATPASILNLSQSASQPGKTVELCHLATPTRLFPTGLTALLATCPLLVLLAGLLRRRRVYAICLLAMAIASGMAATITAKPDLPGSASLVLVDVDSRCGVGSVRYITATSAGTKGVVNAALPTTPLVRHLAMNVPAAWNVTQSSKASTFETTSVGSRAVVSSDATINLPGKPPVEVLVSKDTRGKLTCTVDTSRLHPEAKCIVQLPSGWVVLDSGDSAARVTVQLPKISTVPGKNRLQAWSAYFQKINPVEQDNYFAVILDARITRKYITENFGQSGTDQALKRLGWYHLMKLHTGVRGTMQNQGVVYVESPAAGFSTGLDGREVVFWRITFPLGDD